MNRVSKVVLIIMLTALFLPGCSTTVEVYRYQYDSTLDDVFVKQDADFSGYKFVIIDQVSVWYPDAYAPSPQNVEKAQLNLARAQELFHDSISNALSDRYTVTDEPGKDVLRLHVEFVDLRAVLSEGAVPVDLRQFELKTKPGHITMVGQLFDSTSGEQLARAADIGEQQSVGGNGVVDWDAIASDFEYWANIFSAWMDKING